MYLMVEKQLKLLRKLFKPHYFWKRRQVTYIFRRIFGLTNILLNYVCKQHLFSSSPPLPLTSPLVGEIIHSCLEASNFIKNKAEQFPSPASTFPANKTIYEGIHFFIKHRLFCQEGQSWLYSNSG